MKVCSKCKEEKPLDEFYKVKKKYENQTIFHTARCKKCTNEINVKNSKKYSDYYVDYRRRNKDRIDEKNRKRHREKREKWIAFIREHIDLKCIQCGYDKCFAALDFHHRKPREKEYSIFTMFKLAFIEKNKKTFLEELGKCEILCATCHRERHYYETN